MTNLRSIHYNFSYFPLIYFVVIDFKIIAFPNLHQTSCYHRLRSPIPKFHWYCILSPLVCTCRIFVIFYHFYLSSPFHLVNILSPAFPARPPSPFAGSPVFSRPNPSNRTGGCWTPRSGLRFGSPVSRGYQTTPLGSLGSRSTRPAHGPSERRNTTRWPTSKGCCCSRCCCCSCRRENGRMITLWRTQARGKCKRFVWNSVFSFWIS